MRSKVRTLRRPTEPPPTPPKAVSFSRDSDGKEQRLREWREKNGKATHHDREHRRNRFTASKHGYRIAGEVNSVECAADVGNRGNEIIAAATSAGATIVIIPSLRRLGVGMAQIYWRKQIENAGLTIVSEVDRENTILACEPSPRRDKDLGQIAVDDEYEWARNKERLRQAHIDHHDTPRWQETLDFIAERPHLSLTQLARIIEARHIPTLTGKARWYPQQVKLARAEIASRKAAAALGEAEAS